MIKTDKGTFEAEGSISDLGADLGVAIIGFRGVMLDNDISLTDANTIITRIFATALTYSDEAEENE